MVRLARNIWFASIAVVKRMLWFLFALGFLSFSALTCVAAANAEEFQWKHFGAAPYATTRAEAMQTRASAFRKLGFPEPVVARFLKKTQYVGTKVTLVVGDHLSKMLSKGGVTHDNVVVAFGSPVPHMQYAAPAEQWTVFWQGQTYVLVLPEICHNWSSKLPALPEPSMTAKVQRAADGCAYVVFTTRGPAGDKPADTAVKITIEGPKGSDVASNTCTAMKPAGQHTFGAWRNDVCTKDQPWLCNEFVNTDILNGRKVTPRSGYTLIGNTADSVCSADQPDLCVGAAHKRVGAEKVVLLQGSYRITTQGVHVLRLPGYVATRDKNDPLKYVVLTHLVRSEVAHPAYPQRQEPSAEAFRDSVEYAVKRQDWIDTDSDALGIYWAGFQEKDGAKVATIYYSPEETPPGAPKLYWLFSNWTGPRGERLAPW